MRFLIKVLGLTTILVPASYIFVSEIKNEIKVEKNIFLNKEEL